MIEKDSPQEEGIKVKFTPYELFQLRRQKQLFEETHGLGEVFKPREFAHLKFNQWLVRRGLLTP